MTDVPPGDPRDALIREQAQRIETQAQRIETQAGRIAALEAVVADLREQLAAAERSGSRNSGNSMPPGTDDLPGKKQPGPKPQRGGKKRKPGKQPGAPGAFLAWNPDPDDTKDLFPGGWCGCGRDLKRARDLGVKFSHQVMDLPEAKAQTIQYDEHEVECACGARHLADAPAGAGGAAPGTVTYGPGFQAWCVFLMVMHHVPVERCAGILESMTGARPSEGWVHALPGRAARAVAAANSIIRGLILAASVICGDETPLRAGPGPKSKKMYLQVACTNLLTCYFLGDRTLVSFRDFVYSDLHGTVVVHDRYACYDHFKGIVHQLCTARILRDLEDAAETYPDAIWPRQAAEHLRGLIHQANLARAAGLAVVPEDAIAEHKRLFKHAVNCGIAGLSALPGSKTPAALPLLECLRDREADVLRFLTDTAIPPTSNQAERDLRPAKTQQKISGRLRSVKTTRDRYAIRGYASTAAKHGRDLFIAIHDALAGNPWTPPVPATA